MKAEVLRYAVAFALKGADGASRRLLRVCHILSGWQADEEREGEWQLGTVVSLFRGLLQNCNAPKNSRPLAAGTA